MQRNIFKNSCSPQESWFIAMDAKQICAEISGQVLLYHLSTCLFHCWAEVTVASGFYLWCWERYQVLLTREGWLKRGGACWAQSREPLLSAVWSVCIHLPSDTFTGALGDREMEMDQALPFPFQGLTDQEEHDQRHTEHDVIHVLVKSEICAGCFGMPTGKCLRLPKASGESTENRWGNDY